MNWAQWLLLICIVAVYVLAMFLGRDARFDPGRHRVPREKRPGWRGR